MAAGAILGRNQKLAQATFGSTDCSAVREHDTRFDDVVSRQDGSIKMENLV
eukprot:COSAG06_NODE_7517_length_2474_cov_1.968842_3_plen_51_part_00